jgi:5-methylcytosine-specific restriction endonuclease McrA
MARDKDRKRAADKAWRLANAERKKATDKAWRARNAERKNEADRAWCIANADRVRARKHAWYVRHREEMSAQQKATAEERNVRRRALYASDPERRKSANRAWWRANNSKTKLTSKAWRAAHPERKEAIKAWLAANADKRKSSNDAWRLANIEKVRASLRKNKHRRRARLRDSRSPGVSADDWSALTAHFQGCCAYCGKSGTTIDHVIPISKGGRDEIGNVLPACRRCNSSKGNKDLAAWLNEKGFTDPRAEHERADAREPQDTGESSAREPSPFFRRVG